MGRSFHLEIDERRRSGDIKGALDLARYAHSQLSSHQLLKRSYGWALYAYLKHKITAHSAELSSPLAITDLERHTVDHRTLISEQPRRREINLLCREYRRHKLPVTDLCFSLFTRQLCRIQPAPLGLYGLMKWADIDGMRTDDLVADPERPHEPPLLLMLADHLTSLIITLDHERVGGLTPQADPMKVSGLVARCYERLLEPISPPPEPEVEPTTQEVVKGEAFQNGEQYVQKASSSPHEPKPDTQSRHYLMWSACWTRRRAGDYRQSLKWADRLAQLRSPTPELWWEIAQAIAEEAIIPSVLTSLGETNERSVTSARSGDTNTSQDQLRRALSCALRAAHEARQRGVEERVFAELYARASYWASHIGDNQVAGALIWWAIELRHISQVAYPYSWRSLSQALGGKPADPWGVLSAALKEALVISEELFVSTLHDMS